MNSKKRKAQLASKSQKAPTRFALAKRVYRCLNTLQRRNRFISIQIDNIPISRLDIFLLIELQADPQRGILEFAKLFQVDRTTVSRTIAKLQKQGFLNNIGRSSERQKRFSLTPKGLRAIQKIDHIADEAVREMTSASSSGTLKEVVALFQLLSAGVGEPLGKKRALESTYRVEQRRLTRAFGLLNEIAFDTGLTHLSFHILLLLKDLHETTAAQIAQLLNTQTAALSAALKQLEIKGFIIRKTLNSDRRSILLLLSPLGTKFLQDTERTVSKTIAHAFEGSPSANLSTLVAAFEHFVFGRKFDSSDLMVRNILSPGERNRARVFAIHELVKQAKESSCPSYLFSKNTRCFAFFHADALCGVYQQICDKDEGSEFAIFLDTVPREERSYFLEVVRKK